MLQDIEISLLSQAAGRPSPDRAGSKTARGPEDRGQARNATRRPVPAEVRTGSAGLLRPPSAGVQLEGVFKMAGWTIDQDDYRPWVSPEGWDIVQFDSAPWLSLTVCTTETWRLSPAVLNSEAGELGRKAIHYVKS